MNTMYGTRYTMTENHRYFNEPGFGGVQNPQYSEFKNDREEAVRRFNSALAVFPEGDMWKVEFVERTTPEAIYTVVPVEPPFEFPTAAGSVVSIGGQIFARDTEDENQWISLDGNADWVHEDELRGMSGKIRVQFDGKDLNFD